MHARGDGALGYMLSKHLAGSPIKVSEEEFIAWALEGTALDAERKFALREALSIMDAEEARIVLFDGRAPVERIAELVVQVGAGGSRYWHDLLIWAVPELEVEDNASPGKRWEWSKLALWGGDDAHVLY